MAEMDPSASPSAFTYRETKITGKEQPALISLGNDHYS